MMTLLKRVDLFQSKLSKEFNFKMMGVINITPNSFSDGGKFTDVDSIKHQINHFRNYDCTHFDFGAESTAPFNAGISAREELKRLAPLFELLRSGEFRPFETLSFDTYKLEVFKEIITLVRDELKLTGTKFGCGIAQCGACTVHVDGAPRRSCITPIGSVEGAEITTIEATGSADVLSKVQEAWIEHQTPQCGYCQSGQIMSATALLSKNPNPTDEDIDRVMSGNICRCGAYPRIRAAIHAAAKSIREA